MEQVNNSRTKNRGFASMDKEQQRAIASLGGKKVSQNREYMAEIGRKGGMSSKKQHNTETK